MSPYKFIVLRKKQFDVVAYFLNISIKFLNVSILTAILSTPLVLLPCKIYDSIKGKLPEALKKQEPVFPSVISESGIGIASYAIKSGSHFNTHSFDAKLI